MLQQDFNTTASMYLNIVSYLFFYDREITFNWAEYLRTNMRSPRQS